MKYKYEYYSVNVLEAERVTFELFSEIEKGRLYISAGGRLCSITASVCLDNEDLANKYIEALCIRRKKKDPEFSAIAVKMSSNYSSLGAKIINDSAKVRDKLARWKLA